MAGEATGEGGDRFGPGDTGVHEREIGSSVILDGECVRGSCYRTKTGAGAPWVCTLSFASTPAKSPKGAVWQELREAFGQSTEPDCLLFAWDGQAFTPLSFAQCTKALRAFLTAYGMQDSQVAQYRMHSFKATMLSWMNQLLLGDRARAEQGHHKHKDSVGLYGTVLGRSSRSGRESSWDGGRISRCTGADSFLSRTCPCTSKPLLQRHPTWRPSSSRRWIWHPSPHHRPRRRVLRKCRSLHVVSVKNSVSFSQRPA